MAGAVFSAYSLFSSPNAVAWMASMLAYAVGLVSFHFENKPGSDEGLLTIINVALGIVACLISLGQWLVVSVSGPLALAFSAVFIVIWALRPTEKA